MVVETLWLFGEGVLKGERRIAHGWAMRNIFYVSNTLKVRIYFT